MCAKIDGRDQRVYAGLACGGNVPEPARPMYVAAWMHGGRWVIYPRFTTSHREGRDLWSNISTEPSYGEGGPTVLLCVTAGLRKTRRPGAELPIRDRLQIAWTVCDIWTPGSGKGIGSALARGRRELAEVIREEVIDNVSDFVPHLVERTV